MFFGLPDPHPDSLVRGTDPRTASGSVPTCHGSLILKVRVLETVTVYFVVTGDKEAMAHLVKQCFGCVLMKCLIQIRILCVILKAGQDQNYTSYFLVQCFQLSHVSSIKHLQPSPSPQNLRKHEIHMHILTPKLYKMNKKIEILKTRSS
jgi:hypothetical protein